MQRLELLEKFLNEKGFSDKELSDKFLHFYEVLVEWNQKFNLTSITDIEEVQKKHFIDSILANDILNKLDIKTICDIGCGAGFPSIPLALLNSDKEFVLIDSVNKKITFIEYLIKELGLKNVKAFHSRIEDFAKDNFQSFDACVARAVASMPTLSEYTLPLIKKGGYFIAYKGINYSEELENSKKILSILNSKIQSIDEFELSREEKRYIITIKKSGDCPKKYPRGGNKPRLQPIIG